MALLGFIIATTQNSILIRRMPLHEILPQTRLISPSTSTYSRKRSTGKNRRSSRETNITILVYSSIKERTGVQPHKCIMKG